MIRYKNVLQKLKEAGYSTSRIRKEKLLSQTTLCALRNNKPISFSSLNDICRLLQCMPGELIEYVPDDDSSLNDSNNSDATDPALENGTRKDSSCAERIPKEFLLKESSLNSILANKQVSLSLVNDICRLLQCTLEDIIKCASSSESCLDSSACSDSIEFPKDGAGKQ